MKKLTYLLFAIVLISLFACNNEKKVYTKAGEKIVETKLGKYKVFKHDKGHYSINIPESWMYKKKKGNSMIATAPVKANDNFRESLDIIIMKSGFKQIENTTKSIPINLEKFAADHFKNLQNEIFQLKVEGKGEKIINGNKSIWATFSDKNNKKDLRIIKYVIAHKEKAYIISGNSNFKDFHTFGPVFNEMVESFETF